MSANNNKNEKKHLLSNISGFPELTPEAQILFNKVVSVIRESYEAAGAVPIETSAVERVSHILSKGGNDKEIYGLHRLKDDDNAAKDYALHFDLTLPLARYVSQNHHLLNFPFKRYQIQPVWRGERAQNKRYRQFYQCDIDVIGNENLSIMYDAEMPSIIYHIFKRLDIGEFVIRINNRKILKGLLLHCGIEGDDLAMEAINIIDDLEKKGIDDIKKRLLEIGTKADSLDTLVAFFNIAGSSLEIISQLETYQYNDIFVEGVSELRIVVEALESFGIPETNFKVDLSIARGLDYYTGTVYETQLVQNPEIGSICSGGRYDNLTANFTKKHLPGVGISIGLSRLLGELIEKNILTVGSQCVTPVMVSVMDKTQMSKYIELTSMLRNADIKTELYLENKNMGKQLTYASKKGIPFVVIAGSNEFDNSTIVIKNMLTGEQEEIAQADMIDYFNKNIAKDEL